jgi:GR25 family glycosyltransferase involved in LPS biosynthesis
MLTSLGLLRHYSNVPLSSEDPHYEFEDILPNKELLESLKNPRASDASDGLVAVANTSPLDTPVRRPNTPLLANATLDFGKIYVLNLETREDRHDEMALIAAASGLELTFVPGVNSKTLEMQSLPDVYGTQYIILEPGHLACYRGHANIWRKMIEDDVETALIMEDDIDWDLNVREITPRVKEAVGRITKTENPFSNTPGTFFLVRLIVAWDILYLGTCYEQYFDHMEYDASNASEIFAEVLGDEENLFRDMYDWVEELVVNYFNESTPRRVVVKAKNPVCTHGYAVTQRGARKLLLELNEWMPFPVDITMIHYISEGRFKAYSVLPPMMVQWRNTHDPKKNSDIEGAGIELARNWGFLRSARKHLIDWYHLDEGANCRVTLGSEGHRWWDGLPIRND